MGQKYFIPNITQKQIILATDDAIGPGADYGKYMETGEEIHLKLTGSPTRWAVRPMDVTLLQSICARTKYEPWDLTQALKDPDFAAMATRYVVCGVSGLPAEWPKPAMIQEGGKRYLSWEIIEGLRAAPDGGAASLVTIVNAAIFLHAQIRDLAPK